MVGELAIRPANAEAELAQEDDQSRDTDQPCRHTCPHVLGLGHAGKLAEPRETVCAIGEVDAVYQTGPVAMTHETLAKQQYRPARAADDGLVESWVGEVQAAGEYDELDVLETVGEAGRDEAQQVLVTAVVARPPKRVRGAPGTVRCGEDGGDGDQAQDSSGEVRQRVGELAAKIGRDVARDASDVRRSSVARVDADRDGQSGEGVGAEEVVGNGEGG